MSLNDSVFFLCFFLFCLKVEGIDDEYRLT